MIERPDPHRARGEVHQEGLAGQARYAVDHHAATAADAHPARPAEGERAVELILDVVQRVEHHPVGAQRYLEALVRGFGVALGMETRHLQDDRVAHASDPFRKSVRPAAIA